MIIKILAAFALIIVIFAVVVGLRPAEFRVVRSVAISAPPSAVFAQVNDLHKWEAWSPWAKLDPAMKQTYDGPPAGTGASQTWTGNHKVGEGTMTITESHPSDLIRFRLEFRKPFTAINTSEFTFQPEGNQTLVTWSMAGKNNFMSKAFGLFMNMDKMVGGDFEKGLAELKSQSEAATRR